LDDKQLTSILMNKLLITILSCCVFSLTIHSQIVVSGAGSADNTYGSLTNSGGVFQALNNATLTDANITVTLIGNSTTEGGSIALNQGAWSSLTIVPEGVRTISGTSSTSIIKLSGADFVTINGLNDGQNSLTISNLSTAVSAGMCAINLLFDASYNTISNCYIESGSKTGTVIFGNGTSTGNNYNIIQNCDLGPAGSNMPAAAIISSTTNSTVNSSNVINGCVIHELMPYGSFSSRAIDLGNGNTQWSITGNTIYNSPSNIPTNNWYGVYINNTLSEGFNVSDNIIGFSSADMTGTFTCNQGFYGIYVVTAKDSEVPTTIINNTISNVSQEGGGLFIGIEFIPQFGTNDVEISQNTISNIYSTTSDKVVGITTNYLYTSSSEFGSDNLTLVGNTISNITRTQTGEFSGIYLGMANNADISGNTISNFFLDEIQGSGDIRGIFQSRDIVNLTMNNNEISGITSNSTSVITLHGIKVLGSEGTGNYEYTNNRIHDISGIGGSTIYGIHCNGNAGLSSTKFQNNEVYDLSGGYNVIGIYILVNSDSLLVSSNRVYNLTTLSTQNNKISEGLEVFNTAQGANYVINNSVSALYAPQSLNPNGVIGIAFFGYTSHAYYNTVYLDAQSEGSIFGTHCFKIQGSSSLDIRNNVLINKSTPGSDITNVASNGVASCIFFPSTIIGTPVNYMPTSNNNIFFCAGDVGSNNHKILFAQNGTTVTASASTLSELLALGYNTDSESHVEDVNFVSTIAGESDYLRPNITIPTWVESGAQQVEITSTDIDGEIRFGGDGYAGIGTAPDAGCFEFAGIRPESAISGCIDPIACNFNAEATEDDGSCEYPAQYYLDCEGVCLTDTDGDGICDEIEIYGCTDPMACNYLESATENDGSCSFISALTISGEDYLLYESFATYSVVPLEGSSYNWTIVGGEILSGQGSASIEVYWPTGTISCEICVQETNASGCVGEIFCMNVVLYVIGINEQHHPTLTAFPNPANDIIILKNAQFYIGQSFIILDSQGHIVLSEKIISANQNITMTSLSAGMYMLNLPESNLSILLIKN
jgi:hypothetical protein